MLSLTDTLWILFVFVFVVALNGLRMWLFPTFDESQERERAERWRRICAEQDQDLIDKQNKEWWAQ